MKNLHCVAFTLLVIGGLNWGLIGLFNFNLVGMVFGAWPTVVVLVYVLVGASALYSVVTHMKDCKGCCKK